MVYLRREPNTTNNCRGSPSAHVKHDPDFSVQPKCRITEVVKNISKLVMRINLLLIIPTLNSPER